MTEIGYGAFADCTALTNVDIPEGTEKIDDFAFAGCSSLTRVTLPASLLSIGENAFKGCENLTVTVKASSYAEKYCEENGIAYLIERN